MIVHCPMNLFNDDSYNRADTKGLNSIFLCQGHISFIN
jgi:hypothetical protein